MLSPLAATRVLGPLAVGGPAGGAASSLLTGLLGSWNLDEASGDRLDVSGNGRTLTQSGTVGSQAGVIGNGTYVPTAGGHYLSRAYDSGLHCATQMGLSLWMKPPASNAGALLTRGTAATVAFQWMVYRSNATTYIVYISSSANATISSVPHSAWVHMAISYDGTQADNASRLKAWINGAPQSMAFAGTIPASLSDSASYLLYAHCRRPGAVEWAGGLDLLNIHGRPYTADEVSTLFNGGAGKAYPYS